MQSVTMNSTSAKPNHSLSMPIDKLMQWRTNNWVKYFNTSTHLILCVNYDQAIIYSGDKVVESLSLTGKIKGFYKNDVFIIILNDNVHGLRKIKFQLKSNALQCIEKLRKYFPALSHDCRPSKNIVAHYHKIDDVLKRVFNGTENNDCFSRLPTDYSSFVKLCLMDPSFPQFVNESQNIIESVSMKDAK